MRRLNCKAIGLVAGLTSFILSGHADAQQQYMNQFLNGLNRLQQQPRYPAPQPRNVALAFPLSRDNDYSRGGRPYTGIISGRHELSLRPVSAPNSRDTPRSAHAMTLSQLNLDQKEAVDLVLKPLTTSHDAMAFHNACVNSQADDLKSIGVKESSWPPANIFCEASTQRVLADGNGHNIYRDFITSIQSSVKASGTFIEHDSKTAVNAVSLPAIIAATAEGAQTDKDMRIKLDHLPPAVRGAPAPVVDKSISFTPPPTLILDASIVAGFDGTIDPPSMHLSEQELQDVALVIFSPRSGLPQPLPSEIEAAGFEMGKAMHDKSRTRR